MGLDGTGWDWMGLDWMRWDGMGWDGTGWDWMAWDWMATFGIINLVQGAFQRPTLPSIPHAATQPVKFRLRVPLPVHVEPIPPLLHDRLTQHLPYDRWELEGIPLYGSLRGDRKRVRGRQKRGQLGAVANLCPEIVTHLTKRRCGTRSSQAQVPPNPTPPDPIPFPPLFCVALPSPVYPHPILILS